MAVYKMTELTGFLEVSHIVEISYRGIPGDRVIDRRIEKDFWCLYYIDRGSAYFHMDTGEIIELTSGKGLFFAPLHTFAHTTAGKNGVNMLSVFFACRGLDPAAFDGQIRLFDTFERMLLTELAQLGRQHFERHSTRPEGPKGTKPKPEAPDYVPQLVKSSLEFLLAHLIKRKSEGTATQKTTARQTDLTVSAAVEFMYGSVNKKLKVADIAAAVKMSGSNFRAVFKKATGQSVMDYFNQLKAEQAKILIRKGVHTFGEIAAELGYSSESYFSRQFKDLTGMTPSEYARLVYYG